MRAVGRGPNDDLLASLSRYTNGRDLTGGTTVPAPPTPAAPPAPSPFTPPGRADSPFAPPQTAGNGGLGGGLAAGLSGLSPFQGPQPVGRDRGRPGSSPPAPTPPAPRPTAAPVLGAPAGGAGAATAGGLTRRVRGAQLPSANPLAVRRSQGAGAPAAPAAPAPAAPRADARPAAPAGRPPETGSADAVYSFLTNFTAGVQRGLDESRPDGRR